MTPTIRRAIVEDLPSLRGFFLALQGEQQATHPVDYPRIVPEDADAFVLSMFRALARPSVLIVVADDDQAAVGFLAGEVLEREIGAPRKFGHAHYLYVLPSHRKQGIAAGLIAYAAAWGAAQGVEVAECYGLAGDDGWQRRGFQPLLTRYYVSIAQVSATSVATLAGPAERQRPAGPPAGAPRRGGKKKRQRMNGVALEHDAAR